MVESPGGDADHQPIPRSSPSVHPRYPRPGTRPAIPAPRILLYSHDTYGLGHLRRSLAIAGCLARLPEPPTVLLVTGSPKAAAFDLPPGCDTLKLPSATKTDGGGYRSRTLDLALADLVELRAGLLRAAAAAFRPDLVLVDHAPTGMAGELLPTLDDLDRRRPRPRLVLGLRDIIDDAARVAAQWSRESVWDVVGSVYDRVLVYGDPAVLTTAEELGLPVRLPGRVAFTGYLGRTLRPVAATGAGRRLLVTAGGGGDGQTLLRAYADWLSAQPSPVPFGSVVVTGPLLSPGRRGELEQRFAAADQPVEVLRFTERMDELLLGASGVVAMAGYNTVTEILSAGVPALLLPRCEPRMEQVLRARRLTPVSDVDTRRPGEEPAAAVDRFVARITDPAFQARPSRVRLGGLARVGAEVAALLGLEPVPYVDPEHHKENRVRQAV